MRKRFEQNRYQRDLRCKLQGFSFVHNQQKITPLSTKQDFEDKIRMRKARKFDTSKQKEREKEKEMSEKELKEKRDERKGEKNRDRKRVKRKGCGKERIETKR